ncbi:LOW QUALITY PROTEIN: apolipoprotein L6 [Orycteropus afer afer]|uniref:LOW QUALITY PROTEIN: apolipoprotein L6 n=1 Tax=Orycteropus afer afer TaxID=1230840 RepID=A0A8B7AX70_ORYAF|nr:LOW QUALITY PROTEIN: apolipoprotein L6 [Orycteropus afer afer]
MERSRDTVTTQTSQACKENHSTRGDTSNSDVDKMSMRLVPPELLDIQAGEAYEAGAGLQSSKDDITLWEDGMWDLQEDVNLSAEEITFLKEFHLLKRELEEHISKLHALADHMDTTHETFTKTNMVINSIALASGVMSILGLALPGATLGGSLVLTAAGKGLQAAAGATSILTSICEHFHNKKAQAQASTLVPTYGRRERETEGKEVSYVMAVGQAAYECRNTIKDIKKNIHAFQRARTNPHLAAVTKRLLTTGKVSTQTTRQVQRAFEGTTLVMIKKARLLGIAKAGLFFGIDLATLLKDWKHLKEGAGTEAAKALRAQAQELEDLLTELTQVYKSLKQQLKPRFPSQEFLQEKSLINSTFERGMNLPQPVEPPGEAGCQVRGKEEVLYSLTRTVSLR